MIEKFDIVDEIYNNIFCNIRHRNIDLFLCGAASTKEKKSNRDIIRSRLENNDNLSILYPEDMFMEMLNRKKYDLLTLEKFLASNSDIILIVCESPGSFTELGAFVNNRVSSIKRSIWLIQDSAQRNRGCRSRRFRRSFRFVEASGYGSLFAICYDDDTRVKRSCVSCLHERA